DGGGGGAAVSESLNSSQACTLARLAIKVPPMFWSAETYRLLAAASRATLPSGCGTSVNCSQSWALARLATRSSVLGDGRAMSADTKLPLTGDRNDTVPLALEITSKSSQVLATWAVAVKVPVPAAVADTKRPLPTESRVVA